MSKAKDLTGQRFGRLVAVRPTEERKCGFIMWECKCDCGKVITARGAALSLGNVQSCGCAQIKDLCGQRFGRLVAVRPTEKRSTGAVMWECQCDCGNVVTVRRNSLIGGNTKSCGCLSLDTLKARAIDLAGKRFGKLTAVRPTEERCGPYVVWECRCDCGRTTFVASGNLTGGSVKSCGCSKIRDLTGQRFGRLTALRPTDKRIGSSIAWECQCDCGNVKLVSSGNLVNGLTKSCGCLRRKKKES